MQRSLFRRQEDDEMMCMPDGAPAGRLWLNELDDLVETSKYHLPDLCNVVPASRHAGNTGHPHDMDHLLLRAVTPIRTSSTMQRIVRRAAIRVLHKDKGARQGRLEVPGKTPNGLSTDLYPIGCTIEVFPFVSEHIEASNLVPFDLHVMDIVSAHTHCCFAGQSAFLLIDIWRSVRHATAGQAP